jgi:hypothetical protein
VIKFQRSCHLPAPGKTKTARPWNIYPIWINYRSIESKIRLYYKKFWKCCSCIRTHFLHRLIISWNSLEKIISENLSKFLFVYFHLAVLQYEFVLQILSFRLFHKWNSHVVRSDKRADPQTTTYYSVARHPILGMRSCWILLKPRVHRSTSVNCANISINISFTCVSGLIYSRRTWS